MMKILFAFAIFSLQLSALENGVEEVPATESFSEKEAGSMQKVVVTQEEKRLIGMTVRTNNRSEVNALEGKIFPCIKKYFHENIAAQIPDRLRPGTTYCVYTDYESDHTGEYTYFIGEEVGSFESLPTGLTSLVIPEQKYMKFTNGPAPMPEVVREPWQQIWQMTKADLGGERNYLADYEIYDERASDHSQIVLDIYIGIH